MRVRHDCKHFRWGRADPPAQETRGQVDKFLLPQAAWRGDVKAVKTLLAEGADPNATDMYGRTGLHYAVFIGFIEITRLLVQSGAQVRAADWDLDPTSLEEALTRGHTKVVELLAEKGRPADGPPCMPYCAKGHFTRRRMRGLGAAGDLCGDCPDYERRG